MSGSSASGDFQYTKLEHGLVFLLLCGMVVFLTRTVRSFQQRGMSLAVEDTVAGSDVREGRKESNKNVKFPCRLCNGDHLNHLYPNMQDAQHLLVQQGFSSSQAILINAFPQA